MSSETLPRDQMIAALVLLGFQLLEDSWYDSGTDNPKMQFDLISPLSNVWAFAIDTIIFVDPYSYYDAKPVSHNRRYGIVRWDAISDELLRVYYDEIMEALKCHAKL